MSSDRRYLVLTAVGPDRPGLVQEIAAAIHGASANLEDSRMAILGGEFALILLVSAAPDAIADVERAAAALETRLGLAVALRPTTRPASAAAYRPYRLRVTGIDRPGIVARVSGVLAGHGINVASLESRVQPAPLSGTPLFSLHAELQLPSEVAVSGFRKQLAVVCDDENLDLTLEPA